HAIPPVSTQARMRKRSIHEIKNLLRDHHPPWPSHPPSSILHPPPSIPPSHQMHHYLHLAAALGANPEPVAPYLEITSAQAHSAAMSLAPELERLGKRNSVNPPVFLGLNPGAEYG